MIDYSQPHWRGMRPVDYGVALDRGMTEREYLEAQRKAREQAREERRRMMWKAAGYVANVILFLFAALMIWSAIADRTATMCLKDPAWCETASKLWN